MKSSFAAAIGKLTSGIFFLMIAVAAHAQSADSVLSSKESAAVVKYLGTQDDMLVFNVAYSNADGSKFQLTVKDQDGSQLYQNSFSDKSFYKQFRLPKADKDRIVFIIRDGRHEADIVKAFEINVNSRFVQDVAVKKL
jgi:hypothetical protein